MVEIIYIIIFPIILLLFFNNKYVFNYKIIKNNQKTYNFDIYILNFFIILNFILILSLIDLKVSNILFLILIYYFITNIFLLKKIEILKNIKKLSKYLIFLSIFYLLSFCIISNPDLGWDAKFHWYKKALSFYQNMGFENLTTLPKYEYPHFGTFLWSMFWTMSPLKYEYFGRLFYLFLYLLSIYSITDLIKNNKIKYLLFVLFVIISFDLNHFLGNQDIILFSLLVIMSRYMHLIFNEKKNNIIYYIIFVLINNIILWIKYEAFVYLAILYSVILLHSYLLKKKKRLLILLIGLFITVFLKVIFQYIYEININPSFQFTDSYNFSKLFIFEEIVMKFYFITKYFVFSIFKNPIIIIGFLSLLLILTEKFQQLKINIIIFLLFNLSTFFIFFIIQNEFQWHVINGLDRHMLQYSGFSLLFVIAFVNKHFRNNEKK
jgi:hypothetical protein